MARERYLVNAGEDTIHQNEIKLETSQDKRKNWWYYNRNKLIVGVIAAALLFSLFYSIFSKVKPDYTVALLTSYSMPDNGKEELERCLGAYAVDRNGDGKVVVTVANYVVAASAASTSDELQQQQAELAKLAVDCTTNESMIFLYDDAAFGVLESNFDGFFQYNDGTPMPSGATDFENAALPWSDFAALTSFAPEADPGEAFSADVLQQLYEKLSVSVRAAEGTSIEKKEKDLAYYRDSMEFYERLKSGEPAAVGGQ